MIKPIKRKLLPNTVTYQKYLGDTGTGDSYDTIATLKFVALQRKKVIRTTASGIITVSNAVLFIDAYNSTLDGEPITNDMLAIKSKIIFDNTNYVVTDIETFDYELDKGIHHWELTLL